LPNDETIGGAVVVVTLRISAHEPLNGMVVSEKFPSGWTFRDLETDGANLKSSATSGSAEWVFWDPVQSPGSADNGLSNANFERQIRYELTSPSPLPTEGRQFVTLTGAVSSASPDISETILGEDKITLLKYLPVLVAISHWNSRTSTVELSSAFSGVIQSDQVEHAITLWTSGGVVPRTENATINLATLEKIIAYWMTKRSVYDPLP
jgi:hypothetical protein